MNPAIPDKLFFRIGEVAEITGVEKYVLRYWEEEFDLLKPDKNRSGQRLYKKKDIELILEIKDLLYGQRYTIAGAKKKLKEKKKDQSQQSFNYNHEELARWKEKLEQDLGSILKLLDE